MKIDANAYMAMQGSLVKHLGFESLTVVMTAADGAAFQADLMPQYKPTLDGSTWRLVRDNVTYIWPAS